MHHAFPSRRPALSAASPACHLNRYRLYAALQALVLLLAAGLLALPAHAAGAASLRPADARAIRAAVEGQLDALARDDAQAAFAFAAPSAREAVGTAPEFLAMVRSSYPAIYRPAAVAYLKPELLNGRAVLRLHLTDTDGDEWLAVYSLQQQKNKTWRITGCRLGPNRFRMA